MPRLPNELSDIQSNPVAFETMSTRIRKHGAWVLHDFGLVSHTTIYKWLRREPINKRHEKALQESLKLADEAKRVAAREAINMAMETSTY